MSRQHLQFIRTWTVNKHWLIVYLYHIRMDTPEPQKQFGLWWVCHSISRLKSLIQLDSNSKCRNNILVLTKNNTKHLCKCFGKFSNKLWKQYPPNTWTINIFISPSLHNGIPSLKRFSTPNPPPRPRPYLSCTSTAALASRSRSTMESWPWIAPQCSGVLPQEPRPEAKPQAEPKRRGEKL